MAVDVTPQDVRWLRADRCRRDLAYFIRHHWSAIPQHGSGSLVWPRFPKPDGGRFDFGYLDILCRELERVTAGETRRLVITIPPGHAKSLTVSVFWAAWEWLDDPTVSGHYLSGNDKVRVRDAMRTRDLIQSETYQRTREALGLDWTLDPKHNQKANFRNTEGGQRYTDVMGGKVTGSRADKQVVDDPNDVDEVEKGSPQRVRERMSETVNTWDAKLSDRLNDEAEDPRVLIMQRLHEDDLAGVLQDRDGYRVVSFQTEYDPDYAYNHPDDPRTEPGQLLFPDRFPQHLIDEKAGRTDDDAGDPLFSAKMNQEPTPDEGNIVKEQWCQRRWSSLADITPGTWYQSWDFRNGGEGSDTSFAVGQLWIQPADRPACLALVDQLRGRWDVTESLWIYLQANRSDAEEVAPVNFVGDNAVDDDIRQSLRVHRLHLWRQATRIHPEDKADGRTILPMCRDIISGQEPLSPDASKADRLAATTPYWRSNNIILPDEPWVDEVYVPEICGVPTSRNDDQADATSQLILEVLAPDDDGDDYDMWDHL